MTKQLCGATASLLTLAGLAGPASAAPSDYDGDGLSDIAFHRPDGTWTTVPLLLASGGGGWAPHDPGAPSWANQTGVAAIPGDYNGDGRADIAFHRPGSTWNSVPVLMSNGAGGWTWTNPGVPDWANQPGVSAVAGDYNGDGRGDIAFYRPDGIWGSVPVLFANGAGGWTATNRDAPSWANQPGAIAIPGDYNGDGRGDIAFHRPGGGSNAVPSLFSDGAGGWVAHAPVAPSWANQPGVVAVPGDYDGNGRSDIAFHRPDGVWNSVPVLSSNGTGGWIASNVTAPGWANEPGAIAVAGDYNGDGRSDIAFHRPDGVWNSVPVLTRTASGGWSSTNAAAPSWANQPGVIAVPGRYSADLRTDLAFHRPGVSSGGVPVLLRTSSGGWSATGPVVPQWANQAQSVAIRTGGRSAALAVAPAAGDGGDSGYDTTGAQDQAWRQSYQSWINFLRIAVLLVLGYDEYVRQSGLMGFYDGEVENGHSSAPAFLELEQDSGHGEVHGTLTILGGGLRLRGGICPDVVVPPSALPIHATTTDLYHASGQTSRQVDILGVFSGTIDVLFEFSIETVSYQFLTGTIEMDVPWPCRDQSLSIHFDRRPL